MRSDDIHYEADFTYAQARANWSWETVRFIQLKQHYILYRLWSRYQFAY